METSRATGASGAAAAPSAAQGAEMRLDGTGLRRTMAAVRTMMGPDGEDPVAGLPACRLRRHPVDADRAQVLAAGGNRALLVDVAAEGVPAAFDRALPLAAVRQLARGRGGDDVRLRIEDSTLEIRTGAEERAYGEPDCTRAETWDRIVRHDGGSEPAFVGRQIRRSRALMAVRDLPKGNGRRCRLAGAPGRLLLWATPCEKIGPDYAPEATIEAAETSLAGDRVAGLERRDLIDTLRTMRAKSVDVQLGADGNRIWVASEDCRERFVIRTCRLQ